MRNYKKLLVLLLAIAVFASFLPVLWGQEAKKININQASATELTQLERIGMKYAERIIEFRTTKSIEDTVKVPGIGPKTYEANKDRITVQ